MSATNIATAQEIYSKRVIKALQRKLAPLKAFSLSLNDEAKEIGETVKVPVASPDTVAAWNDTDNNFVRTKATLKEIKVEINARIIAGFAVTSDQMANFRPNWWEEKADQNVDEIADTILTAIVGIITAANFGDEAEDKLSMPLAGFGAKKVALIRAAAVKRKMRPPRSALCLNPDFFSALLGDLDANLYGGREAIVGGAIPGILGFSSVVEIPQLEIPGFLCHTDAIGVASRKSPLPDTGPYRMVRDITEPDTGLVLTNVVYTHGPDGSMNDSVNALYGVGVGNEKALMRLV